MPRWLSRVRSPSPALFAQVFIPQGVGLRFFVSRNGAPQVPLAVGLAVKRGSPHRSRPFRADMEESSWLEKTGWRASRCSAGGGAACRNGRIRRRTRRREGRRARGASWRSREGSGPTGISIPHTGHIQFLTERSLTSGFSYPQAGCEEPRNFHKVYPIPFAFGLQTHSEVTP